MRRMLLCGLLLGLSATAPLASQDSRPGLAVLPFTNGGSFGQDRENFEALTVGIPAMLTSELARSPGLRLVDRAAIADILKEQELGESGRVDAATAARIGRLVGARYVITGAFIDHYGRFRIDARIVDVETSEILKVASPDPRLRDRRELFDMIESLAANLTKDTKLPPLPAGSAAREVPTEALTYYGRALLYEDRDEPTKAVEYYEKALSVFPEYAEAKEGLRKLRSS